MIEYFNISIRQEIFKNVLSIEYNFAILFLS